MADNILDCHHLWPEISLKQEDEADFGSTLKTMSVEESDSWEEYRRNSDSTDAVIAKALEGGCTVLLPAEDELYLDLDTEEQFTGLEAKVKRLSQLFREHFEITRVVPSNSGLPHRHVTVRGCSALDAAVRAGLQLYLGSDPVREVLCLRRAHHGIENPTIFVEGGDWKAATS